MRSNPGMEKLILGFSQVCVQDIMLKDKACLVNFSFLLCISLQFQVRTL